MSENESGDTAADSPRVDPGADGDSNDSGPKQYKKVKHTPLTEQDGWTVLSASAIAAGAVGLTAILAEIATEGWLAQAVGPGIFLSTPIGVGATFLTALVAKDRGPKQTIVPGFFVAAYWTAYAVGMLI